MRLIAIIDKELKQLIRDPKTIVMVLLMPIFLTILFGYGYSGRSKFPVAILNEDRGGCGYELVRKLINSEDFDVEYYVRTFDEGVELVKEGDVYATLVIPSDFTECLLVGKSTYVQVIYDASSPTVAQSIMQLVGVIVLKYQEWASSRFGTFSIKPTFYSVYGPTVTRIENFMPPLMGTLLQLVPTSLISVSICRERERGTFEQFIMTPVSHFEVILGKFVAYFVATISDAVLTIATAAILFNVQFRGSLLAILLLSSIFLASSLALGLLLSVLSKNQLQAYQASIFVFVPAMLFSGMFVPVRLLSNVAEVIAYAMPIYYYIDAYKAVAMKGLPLSVVTSDVVVIVAFTAAFFLASMRMLKLRVE